MGSRATWRGQQQYLLSARCAGILIWNRRIPRPGDSMELVILIGLQGSGKSTFYRAHFAETHVHISKDNFRHNKRPSRRQAALIDEALNAGCSVVVDTVADRAPLIVQSQAHGATVVGYYLATPFALSLERNRRRAGKQRVPDVALYATSKRLEPPSNAEGFDRLFCVRTAQDGTAVIEDWNDRDEAGIHGT
jgi:predicted kinase